MDAGLQSNLALAMLIAGNVAGAEKVASAALARDPNDKLTASVLEQVREVLSGKKVRRTKIEL